MGKQSKRRRKCIIDQRMRFEWYDEELAERIFKAVRHVRDTLPDGCTPTRVRDKVRLYMMLGLFRPHVDGGFTYRTGPLLGESAVYTFVLFLNTYVSLFIRDARYVHRIGKLGGQESAWHFVSGRSRS